MIYTFITEACADLPVGLCCRVMRVSRSGFYQRRTQPVTNRELTDAYMANTVFDVWVMSRRSYGSPRVRAELRLGMGIGCSKTRVERLMRTAGIAGLHYKPKRNRGCTARDGSDPNPDLVNRAFDPDKPDRLWVTDITEHLTGDGKVYCAVVLDAWSRRVIGWSIADHIRAELVADAIQMAIWRRQPTPGQTITHSDHGSQYTSWLFGRRLRDAGILGSMGSIGDAYDNSVAEAFFSTLQRELLDTRTWKTRDQLSAAIFDWIETWYNPKRRHTYNHMHSPLDYETLNAA